MTELYNWTTVVEEEEAARHRSEDFLQISRQTVPLGPSALEVIRYNLTGLEEAELSRLFLENLKVILLLDESERPVVIG